MPTALIVEDEPAANQLLSMLVQLRGYATDSAFSGGEAIEKADGGHPDLVFLDLMLPDINGYEVCEAIKGRRSTTDIPVVMVTARVAGENRIQGFRA
ncbi:MAG TPA: response regulator [Isosphaeraceae bacterium]